MSNGGQSIYIYKRYLRGRGASDKDVRVVRCLQHLIFPLKNRMDTGSEDGGAKRIIADGKLRAR